MLANKVVNTVTDTGSTDTLGTIIILVIIVAIIAYYYYLSKALAKIAVVSGHEKNTWVAWVPLMSFRMWLLCEITETNKALVGVRLFADAFWFYMWVSQPANYSTPTKTINNVIVLISCIAVMYLWFRVAKMYKKSDGNAAVLSILFGFPILNIILDIYFAYFNKDANQQKISPNVTQPTVTTTQPIIPENSTPVVIPSTKHNQPDAKSSNNKGIVLDKLNKPAQKEDIGIRFEISKVNDAEKFQCGYGEACWRIFWQAVDIKLLAGALLRDGDTNATPDHENVYCISITWPTSGKVADIQKSLEKFEPYRQVAANPNFTHGDQLAKESLVQDGIIDQNGQFVGTSYRALRAFENIQKKKMPEETKSVEQSTLSCKLCSKSITDYHYSFESKELDKVKKALKDYWHFNAKIWWKQNLPKDPICDACNSPLTLGESYYSGGWMRCEYCAGKSLKNWDEENNKIDYFGEGEIEKALRHCNIHKAKNLTSDRPPVFDRKVQYENGSIYEYYKGIEPESAKQFLASKMVSQELYYIVVKTPKGNWGVDKDGLYLEKLLPWQKDIKTFDCKGTLEEGISLISVHVQRPSAVNLI
jgi:hypothetical protein